jgi:hypothetical protein
MQNIDWTEGGSPGQKSALAGTVVDSSAAVGTLVAEFPCQSSQLMNRPGSTGIAGTCAGVSAGVGSQQQADLRAAFPQQQG